MIVLGRREASVTLPKKNRAFQMGVLGRSWGVGGLEKKLILWCSPVVQFVAAK